MPHPWSCWAKVTKQNAFHEHNRRGTSRIYKPSGLAVSKAEQPLQVRLLAGGLSAYFLAVFALITWGKGIPTYFHPRAQADLAQLDRQARAEA